MPKLPESGSPLSQSPDTTGQRRLSGAFHIALDRIEPDPDQPRKRIDPAHLEELTASIRRLGVLQPISVRLVPETGMYRIIAGECRYQASLRAGKEDIPCWVRSPKQEDILLHQIVENWQRSDLNPFELADSLAVLRDALGLTQQELAEQTGKSKGEISKLLAILDLPPDVQQLARTDTTGRIGRRHLYALRSFPVERQLRLLPAIQAGRYTAESLEKIAAPESTPTEADADGQPTVQHRTFATEFAKVSFTFRKSVVTNADVLKALGDIDRQIRKGEVG